MKKTDPSLPRHRQDIRIRPAPAPHRFTYHTVPDRAAAEVLVDALFKTHPDVKAWAIVAPTGRTVRIRTRDPLAQPSADQRRLF
jgi:hypothetical protein